ncbi:MAG: adenylate/guanylate cyclase domain-containing protein [Desulfamplus sp.]|nr:adenylate/guanylate cyclase domain-containing protein [Desulfamplus sp.]
MQKLKPIILPLTIPIFIFIFWVNAPFLELTDFAWRDLLYTLRSSQTYVDDIIIVAIDEPSFQQIKLRWPWPRSLHAKTVDNLSSAGAASIAFDILFPEPSNDPLEDIIFSESIRKAGNVVLASNLTITGRQGYKTYFVEEPVPILASAASAIGMVNFYPDGDGSVRMASNRVDIRDSISFASVTTAIKHRKSTNRLSSLNMAVQERSIVNLNETSQAGKIVSLDDIDNKNATDNLNEVDKGTTLTPLNDSNDKEKFFIDYAGKAGTIPAVSYYQVINNMLDPGVFKNKIVFIGFIADSAVEIESGADSYPYPFMRFTKKMISGVEIQANVVRTILKGYPIREFPIPEIKWFCFYLLACILIPVRKNPVYLSISTVTILLASLVTSITLFKYNGIMLDVMPGTAAVAINGLLIGTKEFFQSYREKSVLRKAFDSYVSPNVVARVISNHENLKLGGERKRLSLLFSDIRGFTTLSEKLSPEELVSLLNNYFTRMTDIVFMYNGTLDKYIGDAIMVIFGAPVWSDDHAKSACYTALEMKKRLEEMNLEETIAHKINSSINNQNEHSINQQSDSLEKIRTDSISNNGHALSGTTKNESLMAGDISKDFHIKETEQMPPFPLPQNSIRISIGIGINTGEMIVGNMGSVRRFDYTVMGDEVNLASRLEGVTKTYGVPIIISEATKNDLNETQFLCRELDLIRVKGKYSAIRIYELVSMRSATSVVPETESDDEKWVNLFAQGLDIYRDAYRENRWDDAISLFRRVLEYKKDDGPSKLFIDRCEMFKKNPPVDKGQEWDGVWVMSTK